MTAPDRQCIGRWFPEVFRDLGESPSVPQSRTEPTRRPVTSNATRSVAAYETAAGTTKREDIRFQFGIKLPQLSDDAIKDRILRYVPTRFDDAGDWKSHLHPRGIEVEVMDNMVHSAINRGKKRNVRVNIGPVSGGSSEDPLAIQVKIEPKDTKAAYRAIGHDYVKTVWAKCAGV